MTTMPKRKGHRNDRLFGRRRKGNMGEEVQAIPMTSFCLEYFDGGSDPPHPTYFVDFKAEK